MPPYLAYLGGITLDQVDVEGRTDRAKALQVFSAAVFFVLGFTTVFVAMGLAASAIGRFVGDNVDVLATVAGILIIVLGLHFIGLFRIGFLFREARFQVDRKPAGAAGGYVVGLAFAFGWTPCVGPVLTGILMMAAAKDTSLEGGVLLGVFSLGIGIPFLIAALFAGAFLRFMKRFRRFIPWVERALGAFLILTGILFITGSLNEIGLFGSRRRFRACQSWRVRRCPAGWIPRRFSPVPAALRYVASRLLRVREKKATKCPHSQVARIDIRGVSRDARPHIRDTARSTGSKERSSRRLLNDPERALVLRRPDQALDALQAAREQPARSAGSARFARSGFAKAALCTNGAQHRQALVQLGDPERRRQSPADCGDRTHAPSIARFIAAMQSL